MDLTDLDRTGIEVGTRVSMHFRIRHVDQTRGFRRYFWKAIPIADATCGDR
jgi:hydroxymethylglutaryl-CoA synthase